MNRVLSIVFAVLILPGLAGCFWNQAPPPPVVKPPAKGALVLGAGASRGFAHIGVLKILEGNRVPIHMIVGTSAGSLVGSLYAYGFNAFQLQSLSFPVEKGDIIDLTVPDNGFIKGEKLEAFVNRLLKDSPIEKLQIPFYSVAADIQTGEEIVSLGKRETACEGSCSVPGIFHPSGSDRIYVDGGIVSPVAVDFAKRKGAIGHRRGSLHGGRKPAARRSWKRSCSPSSSCTRRFPRNQLSRPTCHPAPMSHIGSTDFSRRHEAVWRARRRRWRRCAGQAALERLRAEGYSGWLPGAHPCLALRSFVGIAFVKLGEAPCNGLF